MTATEEARELALLAAEAASDKLASDIVLIDVSERLAITDVFLIASGSNERQVEAIVDAVEDKLRAAGRKPLRREGRRDGRWVLLDFGDIVIHIQHTEERVFYALERLWKDCPMISIDPRGGGSTQWVQPSATRGGDGSTAGASELSPGQDIADEAAFDDVSDLDDDDDLTGDDEDDPSDEGDDLDGDLADDSDADALEEALDDDGSAGDGSAGDGSAEDGSDEDGVGAQDDVDDLAGHEPVDGGAAAPGPVES